MKGKSKNCLQHVSAKRKWIGHVHRLGKAYEYFFQGNNKITGTGFLCATEIFTEPEDVILTWTFKMGPVNLSLKMPVYLN